MPWLSGKIPFLSCQGIMEELLCVEEFSWVPIEGQSTDPCWRINHSFFGKGTKPHRAVVLIFEGIKYEKLTVLRTCSVPEALRLVSHLIFILIFHGRHCIWRLKRRFRLGGTRGDRMKPRLSLGRILFYYHTGLSQSHNSLLSPGVRESIIL